MTIDVELHGGPLDGRVVVLAMLHPPDTLQFPVAPSIARLFDNGSFTAIRYHRALPIEQPGRPTMWRFIYGGPA